MTSHSSNNPHGRPPHRLAAYAAIAQDVRLHSRAQHTRAALIEDVMARYGVTRANARVMIHRARKGIQ